jgi:hypothetical protein
VLHFLHFWLELAPDKLPDTGTVSLGGLPDAPPVAKCLCFCGWTMRDHAAFLARCQSPAIPTPYDEQRHGSVEEWILGSLGEFIYFAMPELAAPTMRAMSDVCSRVHRPIFYNVTILPPNYGAPAGRTHDQVGHVLRGNYPWETRRETTTTSAR